MASKPWEEYGAPNATKPWEEYAASAPIDDETGASYMDRFIIGSASSPEDKLARARGIYGNSAMADAEGRISFEKDGKRTFVNPSGFDLGDVVGSTRELASAAATLPFDMSLVGIPAGAAAGATVSQGVDALAAWMARNRAQAAGNQIPEQQMPIDALKDAGIEAGMGLAGGVIGKGVGAVAGKMINPTDSNLVQAWRNLGMRPPSLGAVSDGRAVKLVESAVGDTITGSTAIEKGARAGREGLDNALANIAERIGGNGVPVTPDELGQMAISLAEQNKAAWRTATKAQEDALFAEFGSSKAGLSKAVEWVNKEASKLSPEAARSFKSKFAGILSEELKDAKAGNLNVHTLRSLRTKLGQLSKDNPTVTSMNVDKGALKKLSSVIKEDIEAALTPEQLAAFRKYNTEYATQKETRDFIEKALFSSGKPDAVGKALLSPNLSPETVRSLKTILGDSEFNALRAGILRQVGRPTAGAHFPAGEASPSSFSTLLGNGRGAMAPEAQQMLFGADLDDVRKIAEGMANAGKTFNTSRTASINEVLRLMRSPAQWAQGLGAALDPVTSLAAPLGLGMLHTSPAVIDALSSPAAQAMAKGARLATPRAGLMSGLNWQEK